MKCKIKGLILLILTGFILTACSSNNKPDDVHQELWDILIQRTIYINMFMEEGYSEIESFGTLTGNANELDELSENEAKIRSDVFDLNKKYLMYGVALSYSTSEEIAEAKKEYDEVYSKLEKTFGKGNLKEENFDIEIVEKALITDEISNEIAGEDRIEQVNEKFKNDYTISLNATDVQYDMSNNLNNRFFIGGTLEICDYYNYGFTDDNTYFCGEITPDDGTDSWDVYFDRNQYSFIYDKLLSENLSARISAIIPEKMYKKNQGNMAKVDHIAFDLY